MRGLDVVVFSQPLRSADYPAISIVSDGPVDRVRALKASPGKDIWLFGGGELFRTLLEAGLVDTVESSVVPCCSAAACRCSRRRPRAGLSLRGHRLYPTSGIVLLEYAVTR